MAAAVPLTPARAAPPELVRLGDGRQIGFRTWGTGGPAYVLLHGLLDSSAGWADVADRLGRRCVAFDLPGFGASDQPTRPRISAYVEDVAEAIRLLGLRRFVLVGHSLGGAVAAGVAERLPNRAGALVLLAPAGFGRIALAEAVSIPGVRHAARRLLPLALAHPGTVRTGYRSMVSHGLEPAAEVVTRVTGAAAASVPGAVAATQAVVVAGISKRAFRRRGVAYDGPVVALWGDRDRLVPASHAAGVAAALPQARIEVWPGMGHHPQHERPDALVELMAQVAPVAAARGRRRVAPADGLRRPAA